MAIIVIAMYILHLFTNDTSMVLKISNSDDINDNETTPIAKQYVDSIQFRFYKVLFYFVFIAFGDIDVIMIFLQLL